MTDLQVRSSVYRTVKPRGSRLPMVLAITVGISILVTAAGVWWAAKI